jgi:hypothetical protein
MIEQNNQQTRQTPVQKALEKCEELANQAPANSPEVLRVLKEMKNYLRTLEQPDQQMSDGLIKACADAHAESKWKEGFFTTKASIADDVVYGASLVQSSSYENEGWEWAAAFKSALSFLVKLKTIKETQGKTSVYLDNKPQAWAAAENIIDLFRKSDYKGKFPVSPFPLSIINALEKANPYTDLRLKEVWKQCVEHLFELASKQPASIFDDECPDLSDIAPEEKEKFISGFIELCSKQILRCFNSCGLKTHIECTMINEPTNEKFRFLFEKITTEGSPAGIL